MAEGYVWPPRQPVAVGTADRKRRPVISGEFRKFADLDRFSLDGGMRWNSRYIAWSPRQQVGPGTARWRPMVVARTGGSNRLSALPTLPPRLVPDLAVGDAQQMPAIGRFGVFFGALAELLQNEEWSRRAGLILWLAALAVLLVVIFILIFGRRGRTNRMPSGRVYARRRAKKERRPHLLDEKYYYRRKNRRKY